MYVSHPLSSRLNLVLMSTILTNFFVHLTVTGRVRLRGRQYVLIVGLLEILNVVSPSGNVAETILTLACNGVKYFLLIYYQSKAPC